MSIPISTDYSADDVLTQIEQTDRRPSDLGYLRAIALGLLVLSTTIDRAVAEIGASIDGIR